MQLFRAHLLNPQSPDRLQEYSDGLLAVDEKGIIRACGAWDELSPRFEGLPVQVKDIARALAPVVVYSKDIPMARLEWVSVEDEPGAKD